jgi:hypothetical protein
MGRIGAGCQSLKMKECVQAEGVSVELGLDSESASDLSWENGVSEMAEYCKKVLCNSARPHVDFVLGGSVTDTCLICAPRNMPQEFGFHSLLWFVSTQI